MFARTMSLAATLAVAAAIETASAQAPQDEIVWLESYDEALAEAKRSGKPILLTFRCVP